MNSFIKHFMFKRYLVLVLDLIISIFLSLPLFYYFSFDFKATFMVIYLLNIIFDYQILEGNTIGMRISNLEMFNIGNEQKIGFLKFTIINIIIVLIFILGLKYPLHFFTLISLTIPTDIISGKYQSPLGFMFRFEWASNNLKRVNIVRKID